MSGTTRHGTVIVGASVAGIAAADALRKDGYQAPVRVLDAGREMPHDRPPLSKQALDPGYDDAKAFLREEAHYASSRIDLLLGRRATALRVGDSGNLQVEIDDGQVLPADEVILAPGASPRRLPAESMLPGVHVVRSVPDAVALRADLNSGGRVVVAGCGFIGAEVAASARKRGLDVTVVEMSPRPFEQLVSERPAAALTRLHREHGVEILAGAGVAGVTGTARAETVLLTDGRELPADVVVLGLGVTPSVGWLDGSGVRLTDGIVCDRYGQTSVPGVHAAGDAAAWPDPFTGVPRRIEHWTTAQQQGAAVGHNIACPGDRKSVPVVPYFWSDQHGVRVQSLGWLGHPDEVRCVHGDWDTGEFVALYRRGDSLAGALGVRAARQLMRWRPAIEHRTPWEEITDGMATAGAAG